MSLSQTVQTTSEPLPSAVCMTHDAAAVRRYDIDWLRVLAMLGVFFFHNARFFDPFDWHIKNTQHSTAALVFVGFLNCWQMPLLMLLAGAGSWFALQRRTGGQYVVERVGRLLVPLYTIGLFVLIPPQRYWDQVTKGLFKGSFREFYPSFISDINVKPGLWFLGFWPGHLWFLRWLFMFSLISLPLLLYLRSASGRRIIERLAAWCDRRGGVFLFVIPIGSIEVGLRRIWPGDFGGGHFVYLLAFFLFGYLLMADARFTRTISAHGPICGVLGGAVFLTLAWLVLGLGYSPWDNSLSSGMRAVFSTLGSINTWCWIVLFLALAGRYLNTNSRLLAYANEAVLPFYVLHQTMILAVGRYVVEWNASVAVKYAVITITSFVLIMAPYELLIRRVNVLRVLFGMRMRQSHGSVRYSLPHC